jgi:hypothetical protein
VYKEESRNRTPLYSFDIVILSSKTNLGIGSVGSGRFSAAAWVSDPWTFMERSGIAELVDGRIILRMTSRMRCRLRRGSGWDVAGDEGAGGGKMRMAALGSGWGFEAF